MSDYHVSNTGSDSNPGTAAAPWLTMDHAVASTTIGDHIIPATGGYIISVLARPLNIQVAPQSPPPIYVQPKEIDIYVNSVWKKSAISNYLQYTLLTPGRGHGTTSTNIEVRLK